MRAWSLAGFDSPPRTLLVRYVPEPDDDGFGYWAALNEVWGSDATVVNVEWDMEFSDELTAELLNCPHPCCTHAYRMHHLPRACWAHAHGDPARGGRWVSPGDEWAAWSAVGFCKIAPQARTAELDRSYWATLEQAVNRATVGRWHVHWPGVEHFHNRDGRTVCPRPRKLTQMTRTVRARMSPPAAAWYAGAASR